MAIKNEYIKDKTGSTIIYPITHEDNIVDDSGVKLKTKIYDELENKQDTLISGNNIKTFGDRSLLGSGELLSDSEYNALESGITQPLKEKLDDLPSAYELEVSLNSKENTIPDLSAIRTGAASGATAYHKPSNGIPLSDLASGIIPDVSSFITNAVNNLIYYYKKTETYTKEEVSALIAQQIANAIQGNFKSVEVLPTPSSSTVGYIYLVPKSASSESNIKDEYITTEDNGTYSWEKIGDTKVNLSGYATDEEVANSLKNQSTILSDIALQGYEKTVYNTSDIQNLSRGNYHISVTGNYGINTNYKNAILYVEPGDVIEIVCNSTNGTNYAFVTNYNKSTAEAAIPLPAGISVKRLEAGESGRVMVPEDARAVRIALGNVSTSYVPQSVTVWHNKTATVDWDINGDANRDLLFAPTNYRYNDSDANNAFCTHLLRGHHYLISADIGSGSYAKYSGASTKIPAANGSVTIDGATNSSDSLTGCNIYVVPEEDCFYTLSGASTSIVSNFKVQELKSTDWAKIEDEALVTLLKAQEFVEVDLDVLVKQGHCTMPWFGCYYLGSTYKHVRVPVTPGQYVKVVPGAQNSILAWLRDDEASAQFAMPHYVQGTSSFRYLANSGESFAKVPQGAQYLLVYLGASPYNYKPSFVGIYSPGSDESELGNAADKAKQTLRHRIETRAQVNGLVPMIASIDDEGWELPQTLQQLNTIKKAMQLVKIKWTPKATLPGKNDPTGTAHLAGVEQTGIPYSGNWHDYKYVGIEVSLHTFMTAVNNPYSLLYTENINKDNSKSAWGATYYNTNGWMYYGTVCCGFTASVNGQPTKYGNTVIPKVAKTTGIFIPVYPQRDVNTIRIGDVADNSSHSFVVYAIHHDATGAIDKIKYAESTGSNNSCRIITCNSPESFYSTLDRVGNPFTLYRVADLYKNVDYKPSPYIPLTDYGETAETVTYNNDICCFAGDRATFMEGNRVAINYNLTATPSQDWTSIELYKDDVLDETYLLSEIDQSALDESQQNHALDLGTTLAAGKYKARLTDGTNNSDYTYFEVLNNDITITDKGDGSYTIKVNSGEPMMYVYCGQLQDEGWFYNKAGREPDWLESDANEMRLYFDALLADWGIDTDSCHYVRVVLKGEYGMAATPPILLPGRIDSSSSSEEEESEETE